MPFFQITIYEQTEDPKKHFTIKEISRLGKVEFLSLVKARLATSAKYEKQAVVFVHGYNTDFDFAVYRTAQMVYDLDYDGVTRVAELLVNGSDEIRAAAAAAISGASLTARPEAVLILSKSLLRQKISRVFRLGDDDESAVVVEATARALVTLGGPDARLAVEQRASKADGELKRRLLALLAT